MSTSTRQKVHELLRDAGEPRTIVEIAGRLDVHPNTARFHLDALAASGLVEQVATEVTGPGRPAFAYRAVRRMDPAGPRRYELLAGVLARSLAGVRDARDRAVAAGRDWGRSLFAGSPRVADPDAAIGRLVGLLDEIGFAPERRTAADEQQIGLRHCPFLELAEQDREVVCPVHLGLMQGAMEELGTDVTVESLEPFVEPDLCLTRLGER